LLTEDDLKSFRLSHLATLCLAVAGTAGASQIAQFTEVNQTNDFIFTNIGTGVDFDATSLINFTFAPGLGTPFDGIARQATLTLTSTSSTAGVDNGGNDTQGGFSGTFTIIDKLTGNNLLSGTFGPSGAVSGGNGGQTATFQDSTPPKSEVVFTSFYLDFTPSTVQQAFAFSLSNLNPALTLDAKGFAQNAAGAGTGTFSAQPLPRSDSPEPATVTTIGMALIGLSIYLRKRVA
jgi:hypothetical protein